MYRPICPPHCGSYTMTGNLVNLSNSSPVAVISTARHITNHRAFPKFARCPPRPSERASGSTTPDRPTGRHAPDRSFFCAHHPHTKIPNTMILLDLRHHPSLPVFPFPLNSATAILRTSRPNSSVLSRHRRTTLNFRQEHIKPRRDC